MQIPDRTRTRVTRGFCYKSKGDYIRDFWFTESKKPDVSFRLKIKKHDTDQRSCF